jgi:hypothetical protein
MFPFLRPGRASGAAALAALLLGGLPVPASADPADESRLLTMTNHARAAVGASPLSMDPALSSIARDWASSMAAAGAISHNPNLKSLIGPNRTKAGENVGYGGTLEAIHGMLMNSPAHHANIVDPEFEKAGMGVVRQNGVMWVVEVFVRPASSSAPAAAAPAPAPDPPPASAPAPARARAAPNTTTSTTTTSTTTTTLPPAPPGLPLRLTLLVQQVRALGIGI